MSIRGACAVVFAAAVLTLGGLPGREHAVVTTTGDRIEQLEARVAARPGDLSTRTELVHAYLDAESPGLAWRTLAGAPEAQRKSPAVQHVAARVLIEQGKAGEALALEQSVLSTCGPDPSAPTAAAAGCDFWLIASANRRAAILEQLVQQGVEDAIAQPEASLVAYHNATREARLTVVE